MDSADRGDDEQMRLWNGPAGRAWLGTQDVIEHMFKPFEEMLVETVTAGSEAHVLDVGCGVGGTTLAVARRLRNNGSCTGVDISAPMIAAAQAAALSEGVPASFVCANAETYAFQPDSFDTIISRFGVMFFENPVRAFSNLRHAAKDRGELRFVAWRGPAENPFMTTAERAAAPLLPNLPARRPGAPGQFAFADRDRINTILQESGWAEIDIRPIDVTCTLPEKDLVRYLSQLGPVGLMLQETDSEIRNQVITTVRAAFSPFVHGPEVRFTAACWIVSARAPSAAAAAEETMRD
ncbi:class I SAM-dependent methyltransferase [Bradyrhizobium sp. WSM 1738]|uniref:class I SAM-dependent methyltransferase n=1 Tax=Bradyrhizobium hereditatis TaxID=2821405 RepID=UPI001CE2CDFD|nr:class I SAM-dependent methyltransferase [Bradyrhizobium hereditatis]MCA6119769.1 class I SAM-dependent methyltransferase [Bradyrhizobium hereditatis]